MQFDFKRVAILTAITLLPVTAFAAAATGADGGLLSTVFESLFTCSSGGCPNSP